MNSSSYVPTSSLVYSMNSTLSSKYTKPSTGIPKSDLSSEVQGLLGGGISLTLLWTNQNLSSGTFTGQKLPINTTGYKMLLYKVYYSSSYSKLEMASIVKIGEQSCIYAIGNGTNMARGRAVGSDGITIEDLGSSYNTYVIPVRVYGIK